MPPNEPDQTDDTGATAAAPQDIAGQAAHRATRQSQAATERAAERAADRALKAAERAAQAMAPGPIDQVSTRERILDVALDLFIEQGYDKTSLREVAEKMGFTKAALYYHFPSKLDMLAALHQRMHSIMDDPLSLLGERVAPAEFEVFLTACLKQVQANQKLFVLHRLNAAALAQVHIEGHEGRHEELEERARSIFSDPSLSEDDRLRMAAAFCIAVVTPMMVTGFLPGQDPQGLVTTMTAIVHEVLRPGGKPGAG